MSNASYFKNCKIESVRVYKPLGREWRAEFRFAWKFLLIPQKGKLDLSHTQVQSLLFNDTKTMLKRAEKWEQWGFSKTADQLRANRGTLRETLSDLIAKNTPG